jgi:hypothetical protein
LYANSIAAFSRGSSTSSFGMVASNWAFACVFGGSPAFFGAHQYFCGSGASPYP